MKAPCRRPTGARRVATLTLAALTLACVAIAAIPTPASAVRAAGGCGLATTDSPALCIAVGCGGDSGEFVGAECSLYRGYGNCVTVCAWNGE